MPRRLIDDPNMSDATILITVEDLIYRALGSPDECNINFKLLQMILHILARQMRMLEQLVEIREDMEVPKPESPEPSSKPTSGKKKSKKEGDTEKETDKKKQKEEEVKEEKLSKKEEKAAKKQREKAEKERKKLEEENEKEKARDKSPPKKAVKKAKIAETDSRTRVNIEVVTQSKFALLEAAVEDLKSMAAPKQLELPDNEQLKSDIASGNANLPDTMQAMQVNARVKAAEEAINRMAGILTQLALAGDLPEELAEKINMLAKQGDTQDEINELKPAETTKSLTATKSVAIDPKASQSKALSRPSMATPVTPKPSQATSKASMASKISSFSMAIGVTHNEMDSELRQLHLELSKDLNNLTTQANTTAENALHTAKVVADRLDVALKIDSRISTLYSLVGDYAEQLSGFDSGLTTQMQSFRDQMAQISADLKSGLDQLQNVNNNAETAAIMELTERYKELMTELDSTAHAHKTLNSLQTELGGEMHSLVECVEMLREQKCDRDEVIDGLRDKADSTRLAGLLTETEFASARADFERRIELCHDKFKKQDAVWAAAIRDLTDMTDKKAEIVELLASRDNVQTQLQELHEKIRILAAVLGEPKAAILTRQLAAGAVCGACGAVAAMSPRERVGAGARPAAPPCLREWVAAPPESDRHACRRWCGGSHTLVSGGARAGAGAGARGAGPPGGARFTHYADYGDDGRLYMMADELKPCLECNVLNIEGAGDSPAPPPPPPQDNL